MPGIPSPPITLPATMVMISSTSPARISAAGQPSAALAQHAGQAARGQRLHRLLHPQGAGLVSRDLDQVRARFRQHRLTLPRRLASVDQPQGLRRGARNQFRGQIKREGGIDDNPHRHPGRGDTMAQVQRGIVGPRRPAPIITASFIARSPMGICPRARPGDPLALPVAQADPPVKRGCQFQRQPGPPALHPAQKARLSVPGFGQGRMPVSTAIPAARNAATPRPATRASGSPQPMTTRATPASISAVEHGPVCP